LEKSITKETIKNRRGRPKKAEEIKIATTKIKQLKVNKVVSSRTNCKYPLRNRQNQLVNDKNSQQINRVQLNNDYD
jgi:hypothetical protein